MHGVSWRTLLMTGMASLGLSQIGCAEGPRRYSDAWYAQRANDPPGARQVESHGKLWPPFPRPVGRKQTCAHAYHYAHYWPYPHNLEDEAYTRNLIDLQAASGWVTATTLRDYHFNPDTQQLTEGGRHHLMWIAQNIPAQYRTVYISSGDSREVAQMRMDNSEQFYRDLAIPNPPPVLSRAEVFIGRPAVEVERIRTLELQSIPRPRLFYIGSATAAGGAGGGAGGATGTAGGLGAPAAGGQGTTTTR